MRLLVLFFVLLGLTACEDTFAVNRPNQLSKYILSSATGYVTVPQDGRFGAIAYLGIRHEGNRYRRVRFPQTHGESRGSDGPADAR